MLLHLAHLNIDDKFASVFICNLMLTWISSCFQESLNSVQLKVSL